MSAVLPQDCPAFVIGLDRAPERYRAVRNAWRDIGVDVRLWQGVDGKQLIRYRSNEALCWKERPSVFLPAVIGCYLSHFRLWQYCLEQGYERVLILEDDAFPQDALPQADAKSLLAELSTMPDSYELIRLMALSPMHDHRYPVKSLSTDTHTLCRPYSQLLGTDSFFVNRRGLEKLVAKAMPIEYPVDLYLYRIYYHKVRLYQVFPWIVRLSGTPSVIRTEDQTAEQEIEADAGDSAKKSGKSGKSGRKSGRADVPYVRNVSDIEWEFWDFKLLLFNYALLVRNLNYILRTAEPGEFVRDGKVPPRLLWHVLLQPAKLIWQAVAMSGRVVYYLFLRIHQIARRITFG